MLKQERKGELPRTRLIKVVHVFDMTAIKNEGFQV